MLHKERMASFKGLNANILVVPFLIKTTCISFHYTFRYWKERAQQLRIFCVVVRTINVFIWRNLALVCSPPLTTQTLNEYPKKGQLWVVYAPIVIGENYVCNRLLRISAALCISKSASQSKLWSLQKQDCSSPWLLEDAFPSSFLSVMRSTSSELA